MSTISKKSTGRFPKIVKAGSVNIKLYRVRSPRSRSGWLYTAAWYEAGLRQQKQSTDLDKLIGEAKLKAEQLAAGRMAGPESVSIEDMELLRVARDIVGETPVISALREWKRARELAGGDLVPAAQAWSERVAPSFQRMTVTEAKREFIKYKTQAGLVMKNYNMVLPKLEKAYGGLPMDKVTQPMLQKFLMKMVDPVTRNTYRKILVVFWRWSREAGYLPRDVQTEAERTERAYEEAPDVGIIDAKRFHAALLHIQKKKPRYMPQLILAGFCGLRRVEIHGQRWEDVNLERKFVRVTTAKKGTPARRLVPLCDAALEWLTPYAQPGGDISPGGTWALDRIRSILRSAKFTVPKNCFRHAYISHRVAATGDVAQTALDAGNSPAIIHRHYRELVSPEEGRDWFNITPDGIAQLEEGVSCDTPVIYK